MEERKKQDRITFQPWKCVRELLSKREDKPNGKTVSAIINQALEFALSNPDFKVR